VKPRLLIVGRSRYRLPLEPNLERKFAALRAELELRVLASARDGSPLRDDTFSLAPPRRALDGPRFWVSLPLRVRRELAAFRPAAVLVQPRCPVVVEIHGDWRTATRLYGSRARRPAAPLADRIARAALRRVDAVRTISSYTSSLVRAAGVEPAAEFPAFIDLDPFLAPPAPLPEQPRALFVGVLEPYKDVDGLAAAWRLAAPRLPRATLRLVGRGSRAHVAERLVAALPRQTAWIPELPNAAVPAELDAATILVLPSRSEGLGRVVVEALCRGRPVVADRK